MALGPVGPIPAGPFHLLPSIVSQRDAYTLLLVVALIWAGNFPLSKLGLVELGPLTLSAARALIAAPLLALTSRALDGPLPPLARRDWAAAMVLALTGFVGNFDPLVRGPSPHEPRQRGDHRCGGAGGGGPRRLRVAT